MTKLPLRAICLSFAVFIATAPVPAMGQSPPETNNSINPALAATAHLIASSNLLEAPTASKGVGGEKVFQSLLETGRKLRTQKNYEQARKNFVTILESDAPESMYRTAMVELALMAQEQGELARAQQIFSQYVRQFHDDPSVPEVLLRQGLIYRQMGASSLALVKFYAVMTTALSSKTGSVDQYQRLVLLAQTEIADTYMLQGKQEEAAEFYARLLKLDSSDLNKGLIQYKLIRCLSALSRYADAVGQAKSFLERHPDAPQQPEVRFLYAGALKHLGQKEEAVRQVLALLQSQQTTNRANWVYWQQRAGNEIANQFYEESNFVNALDVYTALAGLDSTPNWQMPVWYQIGIVYERLQQPGKAIETYGRVIGRDKELGTNSAPGLKAVVDMAKWRANFLSWQTQAGSAISDARTEFPASK